MARSASAKHAGAAKNTWAESAGVFVIGNVDDSNRTSSQHRCEEVLFVLPYKSRFVLLKDAQATADSSPSMMG
jgi:hypothetical protein